MPNPYPIELRTRAVRAYETGTGRYVDVAATFGVSVSTLLRWVQRARATGDVAPLPKGGGWVSPVDVALLHRLVEAKPDQTTEELTRAYNRQAAPDARVHRSSILRALQRTGYVFKRNARGPRNRIGRRSRPNASPSANGSKR